MLTRKELCQYFLLRAQQKFGKTMSDLDVYYAGAEVGIALSYLGYIKDTATLDYIKNNTSSLFKHPNGKNLTYSELLDLLPEDDVKSTNSININSIKIEVKVDQNLTEEDIRNILGERKFFRLLDSLESLDNNEINLVFQLLKIRGKINDTDTPDTTDTTDTPDTRPDIPDTIPDPQDG